MTPSLVFQFSNAAALLGWGLLVVFPKSSLTQRLVHQGVLPLGLSLVYLVRVLLSFSVSDFQSFSTLEGVTQLFSRSEVVLAGWVHYLAFDLLIGAWIARDAHSRGFKPLGVVPVLLLTFYLGPVGFLSYAVLRTFRNRVPGASV
ncbi:MAG: hypothetical protein RJB38_129 [Pseudomonadota bacterium]